MRGAALVLLLLAAGCGASAGLRGHAAEAWDALADVGAHHKTPQLYALTAEAFRRGELAEAAGDGEGAEAFYRASLDLAQACLWEVERGTVSAEAEQARAARNHILAAAVQGAGDDDLWPLE